MSSILDALKKLEKDKIHRDQISTAIASDILRTTPRRKRPSWLLPSGVFALVLVIAILALALRGPHLTTQPEVAEQQVTVSPPVETKQATPPPPVIPPSVQAHAPDTTTPSDLPVLSGIVFQQQPEARMAILNDLPVMEGMTVAAYTLKQIRPDSVILSRDGRSFTLRIPFER